MKKFLLLASVAGCLLAHNAMAGGYGNSQSGTSGTLTLYATIGTTTDWAMIDVNFGNILLGDAAEDDDVIATFTDGSINYVEGKVIAHGTAEPGCIALSSYGNLATGVSFSPASVDLKDSSYRTVAQVTNLGVGDKITGIPGCTVDDEQGYYIDAQLVLKDRNNAIYGETLSGTTTVTLQF